MRHKLGTDAALINGIMNVILAEGWQNQEFVDERCEGFEEFKALVEQYTPDRVSEITGVSEGDIRLMAQWYAQAKASSIVYCMGITQHTTGVDNVKSLANLSMLCGQIGRESTGVNPLRGQNNVQGACDMGGLPNVYPGYQPVTSEDARKKFEAAWGVELNPNLGLTIPDILDGINNGDVRALYVMGENPVMSDPDSEHVVKALKKADLLIVQDIFLNQTAEMAHVVLPGATYCRKGRHLFQHRAPGCNASARPWSPWATASPTGGSSRKWPSASAWKWTLSRPNRSWKRSPGLRRPTAASPTTAWRARACAGPARTRTTPAPGSCTPANSARGKGLFHAIEYRPPAECVDAEYPMWLTTGRAHVHYHTGTMTRNSPSLHAQMPTGFVEVSPADAQAMGHQGRPACAPDHPPGCHRRSSHGYRQGGKGHCVRAVPLLRGLRQHLDQPGP